MEISDETRAGLTRLTGVLNEALAPVMADAMAGRRPRRSFDPPPRKPARSGLKLTKHELGMIDAMRGAGVTRKYGLSCTEVAALTGQTYQGAGRVLASAARKDLVRKHSARGRVPARFTLTDRGWRLTRPRTGLPQAASSAER